MINVGCDIRKSNLEIYLNRKLRRYPNNETRISEFVKQLWVILEPSGEYEKRLLTVLHYKKVPLSVVNTYYVRNFARGAIAIWKTDKIDAQMLSEYGERMNPRI